MNLLAERCTPFARSLSSSPPVPCSAACSQLALRWFSNGGTTGSTVSRVGEPAAIVDGRGPGINFGLCHPGCDVGFFSHEVGDNSCRASLVVDSIGGFGTDSEDGPPF